MLMSAPAGASGHRQNNENLRIAAARRRKRVIVSSRSRGIKTLRLRLHNTIPNNNTARKIIPQAHKLKGTLM
jgi:hypothetical protein